MATSTVVDCALFIYLFSFKRKASPTFVTRRPCSTSHQPSLGPVSEDRHRDPRHSQAPLSGMWEEGPSWRLRGHLSTALSTYYPQNPSCHASLPALPRTFLRQRLTERKWEEAQLSFHSRSPTVLVVLFDFRRGLSSSFKHCSILEYLWPLLNLGL